MKKTIMLILCILILIVGCDEQKESNERKENRVSASSMEEIYTVICDGYKYVIFDGYKKGGIVHAESCECKETTKPTTSEMKKPKLYVKLPNGRYAPYVEEKVDTRLYVKRGNKYVPWAMDMRSSSLDEGVWVVTKHRHSTSYANATHLYEAYKCIKCGDIVEAPSLAELGGYEKLAAHLLQHWSEVDTTCVDTICKSVVGILMKYKNEKI